MRDTIQCPQCGKRYPWKAALTGRKVKCQACECQFTVSAPTPPEPKATSEPKADNPLGDLFDEEFADIATSTEAALDESAGLPATGAGSATLAPIGSKRKKRKSQSGPDIGVFVAQHKLMLGVIVVTLLASGLMVLSGVVFHGVIALPVGLAIAASGLLPYPARNESKSGHFFIVAVFVYAFGNLIHAAYTGKMKTPDTENVAYFAVFVVGLLLPYLILGFIAIVIGLVFRCYGFFRVAACGHIALMLVFAVMAVQLSDSHSRLNHPPSVQRNDSAGATTVPARPNFAGPNFAGTGGSGQNSDETDTLDRQPPEADPLEAVDELADGPVDEQRLEEVTQKRSRPKKRDQREVLRKLLAEPVDPQRREEVTGQLLPLLSSSDHFIRLDAIKAFGLWHTDEALPELIKLLTDEDMSVHRAAFKALENTKDIRAIEAVARLWATGERLIYATQTLETMGPVAEETVLEYLNVQDTMHFMEAMRLLEKIGTQRCLPTLAELVRTGDFHTSVSVRRTGTKIANAGRTPEDPIRSSASSTQESDEAGGPMLLDADLTAKAVAALQSDDPARCRAAAEKLAEIPLVEEHRPPIAQALIGLLAHKEESVRVAAMKALGTWHTQQSIPEMIERLDDESLDVQNGAMDALSKTQDLRAAAALAKQLDGIRPDRAARCLEAMGPVAEEAVLKYLDHTNPTTLAMACKALAKIGTEKSLAKLDSLADHANLSVGSAALKAANAIRSNR